MSTWECVWRIRTHTQTGWNGTQNTPFCSFLSLFLFVTLVDETSFFVICTQNKTFSFVLLHSFGFLLLGFIRCYHYYPSAHHQFKVIINVCVLCIENSFMDGIQMGIIFLAVLFMQANKRKTLELLSGLYEKVQLIYKRFHAVSV